jgi:hypothetical protein
MAKQDINIGAFPGDDSPGVDVTRSALQKAKENFDELYNRPTGDMNKSTYDSDNDGSVNSADKIKGIDAAANETFYGKDNNGNAGFYGFNSTHSHKEEEITGTRLTTNVLSTYTIDWNTASVFDLTMLADTTFSFSNLPTGTDTKIITIYLTGNYTPTFPTEATEESGDTYDGTINNRVTIDCVNGNQGTEKIFFHIKNL